MDKEFVISYLKTRNYWWQTREVSSSSADTRGLIEFMHAFNLDLGIIVTKDVLKPEIIAAGKEITFIPLWLFLLLL